MGPAPSLLAASFQGRRGLGLGREGALWERPRLGQAARVPSTSGDADRVCCQLHRRSHHILDPLTPSVRTHVDRLKTPFLKHGRARDSRPRQRLSANGAQRTVLAPGGHGLPTHEHTRPTR